MHLVCSDLEGVFIPEIWINVAEKTGIEELRLTTRDISDYDVLMKRRLAILKDNGLTIHDIQAVIATMAPLDGALDFLAWLRARTQVIIVSDTFDQFMEPMMAKLGWPTLFCHTLTIAPDGLITGYNLRQADAKRNAVIGLQKLNYRIIAMGDSYNDINMLLQAEAGILFSPPEKVKNEFPQLPVAGTYAELEQLVDRALTES